MNVKFGYITERESELNVLYKIIKRYYIPPITNDEINNPETYIPPNLNDAGYETEEETYIPPNSNDAGYETEEAYGGKEKTNRIRKNSKRNKTRKTSFANKKTKKGGKRKTRKNKTNTIFKLW